MATSNAMPERHYNKLEPYMKFRKLSDNEKKQRNKKEEIKSEKRILSPQVVAQLQELLNIQKHLVAEIKY
ncbi:MAG: putative component of type VI protein secretion system [Paraglaciecola psychrophila]|jgi:predicted component of type VI protein secretion system